MGGQRGKAKLVVLSAPQRRALEQCAAMTPVDENDEGWLALGGSGIMRTTVRALQNAGVIEAKNEGYAGKLIGQYYRVTRTGRDALASREDGGR